MRLWSISPQYLDTKGLLALWREGLLAQNVLLGLTKGYRSHPQCTRFLASAGRDLICLLSVADDAAHSAGVAAAAGLMLLPGRHPPLQG